MELTVFQVDSFADEIFQGNPAAVCILDEFLPDFLMQAIASELNLSETAFVAPKDNDYRIRWFTPTREVKLCGHATLASAHVLKEHFHVNADLFRFHSLSGWLTARTNEEDELELDFPSQPGTSVSISEDMLSAVGGAPVEALAGEDLLLVYSDSTEITILEPDFAAVKTLPYRGVIVTAPCSISSYDFVCRFFAPAYGINEDPVTGSAYTMLAPYYSSKMGKFCFRARQASKRGGNVGVSYCGDRVKISGTAVTVMHSTLYLPERKNS